MQPTSAPEIRVAPLDEAGRANRIEVDIAPAEQPELTVTFEYVALPGELLGPYGLRVHQRSPLQMGDGWQLANQPARLGVAILRDLPIARWERTARMAAQVNQDASLSWAWGGEADPGEIEQQAEQIVKVIHPDVDPLSGKAGARKWAKLTRYAQVALQWQQGHLAGDPDPVGTVASDRGVSPATVRSWLYRAKLEGITPETVAAAMSRASEAD